jgi:hypothetical protein
MEQITSSLAARTAPKSTVSGSGSDAAGSVTKRFFFLEFSYNSLISSGRLSNELMTLMVSVLRVQPVALLIKFPDVFFTWNRMYQSFCLWMIRLTFFFGASSQPFQSLMPTSSNG